MTSSNSTSSAPQQPRKPASNSRGWLITINNPMIPGDAYLRQWMADGTIVFGCGQKEVGAQGTAHLQLYIVTKVNDKNKNGFTQKWIKENIHSTAHVEPRRGSHDQARDYCTKDDTRVEGPWVVGEWSDKAGPSKGGVSGGAVNASKILSVKRAIDDGVRDSQLYQEHFGEMLRYGKAFERYRVSMLDKSRSWQTKAMVLHGPAGSGKTMRAWHVAKQVFGDDVYPLQLESETIWWDGYSGQKCVIIDEFYGNMKVNYFLKLLDRYPLLVQTKGGMTPFLAEMIIITSNKHPDTWWNGEVVDDLDPLKRTKSKVPPEVLAAVKRRLSGKLGSVKEMKDLCEIQEDDMEDFATEWANLEAIADELAAPTPEPTPPTPPSQERHSAIDLTAEDEDLDFDDKEDGYQDYNPEEDFRRYEQAYEEETYDERRPSQLIRRNAMVAGTPPTTMATSAPPLKKLNSGQHTSFGLLAPPKATQSEWKAVKQVPGQTKLVINAVTASQRFDDDE